MKIFVIILGYILFLICQVQGDGKQPNVIFILADDLGWNDVSWNNPDMPTHHMEKLAQDGIRLEQSYSQQVCTPSRAALLTGRYPFHIGRQKRALKPLQPTGLMLNLTTLPQELKQLGYQTHMVGKWHLGYCAWEYTPTRRGFDSFLGFYLGSQNHFSHDREYKSDGPAFYDFRFNENIAPKKQYQGVYSTVAFKERSVQIVKHVADTRDLNAYGNYKPFFLYLSFQATHAPLQARAEILAKIPESTNPARDIYKAMVYDMDLAIGEIVQVLKDTGLYNDTVIVVTSDNGGAISHGASNYPLRGTKGTLFEGGTRVPTIVSGPPHLLPRRGVVSNSLVHITDWMPTILALGGYVGDPTTKLQLDGVNQLPALTSDQEVREEMVYNLKSDPISGAFRHGPYKIIFGKKFNKQGWYDTDNVALQCSRMMKKERKKAAERSGRKIELKTSQQIEKTLKTLEPDDETTKKSNNKRNIRKKKKGGKGRNKAKNRKKDKGKKDIKKGKVKKNRGKRLKNRKKKQRQRNKNKSKGSKREKRINKKQSSAKNDKREENRKRRKEGKLEKKINKIWKDWLPLPSAEVQNMLRLRMEDCNWEDFSGSGHTKDLELVPRSSFRFGDIVQMIDPLMNPFNITSEDEANEFEYETVLARSDDERKLEKMFNKLDFAMYNVIVDPEERNDLKHDLPVIYQQLRKRTLEHLSNIVPEDFPDQDFSGHPDSLNGYFSPGWCEPKYV